MFSNRSILLRGGGDLATGVALRLQRAGLRIVITELAQPLAVRRAVSFAEAVYEGSHTVEGVEARRIEVEQLSAWDDAERIPILVDPDAEVLSAFEFAVVVDARLLKSEPKPLSRSVPLHVALGPGFSAGDNCHAVIETRRSHTLGRVLWTGSAQPDSGQPEGDPRRVLRATEAGVVKGLKHIGEFVEAGETVAVLEGQHPVVSPLAGVLRGLIRDGVTVTKGLKLGDVDPRGDVSACFLASDKSLAIGGGVLEAILSKPEIRQRVY